MLARVVYELFEWETDKPTEPIVLHRQLRLELRGGTQLYIAWTWGPSGGDYHVGRSDHTFCTDEPEYERDVSHAALWAPLVDHPVTTEYLDRGRQALLVQADGARVYCCSSDGLVWGMDCLWVARTLPAS